ncbi:L-threonine 3-dehydrogenase [Achromobacter sp. NPDC058515]|uniref:L-threonine 3-dehydrogenase n=1 Tax=Achromobacter sp. NPDC058515 TaxID=3346533 RepID=UPI003656CA63
MLALVKAENSAGLWLQQVARPIPAADEVLIQIRKTGICGTDLHIWNWDDWARKTVPVPLVTGHEYAGEIVEVGKLVSHLRPGMRVSGEGHIIDINSAAARAGRFHLDPNTRGIGVNRPGAFAEYLALPAFNVIPLPDEIDDELGAILDPLGNAVHVALSFDLVGEDVLITGAGPIGIMAAAVARHVGARNVVLTDVNPVRLALASRVADVVTVNPREMPLADVMSRLHIVNGFSVGFEMSGYNEALEQLIGAMEPGGRVACLGLPSGRISLDWSRIVCKGLFLKGIYGREMFETWRKMLNLIATGLDVRGIITHRLPVDRYKEGFQAMLAGDAGKVVLSWPA